MEITVYVYSDESGVFDPVHNEYYVFGGVILLSREDKESAIRYYKEAEKNIAPFYDKGMELKASKISTAHRAKLFRATNHIDKFGVVITQARVHSRIFESKKSKQRYLDYAYKIGVKNALMEMMDKGLFDASSVDRMVFNVDEHTTATDGIYELREGLLQEFKEGTFNYNYQMFFPPIFPNLVDIQLNYCNSKKQPLVRASDVIANRIYYEVTAGNNPRIRDNLYIKYLP